MPRAAAAAQGQQLLPQNSTLARALRASGQVGKAQCCTTGARQTCPPPPPPARVAQASIKAQLPTLLLATPPLVRAQLSEALALICNHDFPKVRPLRAPGCQAHSALKRGCGEHQQWNGGTAGPGVQAQACLAPWTRQRQRHATGALPQCGRYTSSELLSHEHWRWPHAAAAQRAAPLHTARTWCAPPALPPAGVAKPAPGAGGTAGHGGGLQRPAHHPRHARHGQQHLQEVRGGGTPAARRCACRMPRAQHPG